MVLNLLLAFQACSLARTHGPALGILRNLFTSDALDVSIIAPLSADLGTSHICSGLCKLIYAIFGRIASLGKSQGKVPNRC